MNFNWNNESIKYIIQIYNIVSISRYYDIKDKSYNIFIRKVI